LTSEAKEELARKKMQEKIKQEQEDYKQKMKLKTKAYE
jgi:hypothetical protein